MLTIASPDKSTLAWMCSPSDVFEQMVSVDKLSAHWGSRSDALADLSRRRDFDNAVRVDSVLAN